MINYDVVTPEDEQTVNQLFNSIIKTDNPTESYLNYIKSDYPKSYNVVEKLTQKMMEDYIAIKNPNKNYISDGRFKNVDFLDQSIPKSEQLQKIYSLFTEGSPQDQIASILDSNGNIGLNRLQLLQDWVNGDIPINKTPTAEQEKALSTINMILEGELFIRKNAKYNMDATNKELPTFKSSSDIIAELPKNNIGDTVIYDEPVLLDTINKLDSGEIISDPILSSNLKTTYVSQKVFWSTEHYLDNVARMKPDERISMLKKQLSTDDNLGSYFYHRLSNELVATQIEQKFANLKLDELTPEQRKNTSMDYLVLHDAFNKDGIRGIMEAVSLGDCASRDLVELYMKSPRTTLQDDKILNVLKHIDEYSAKQEKTWESKTPLVYAGGDYKEPKLYTDVSNTDVKWTDTYGNEPKKKLADRMMGVLSKFKEGSKLLVTGSVDLLRKAQANISAKYKALDVAIEKTYENTIDKAAEHVIDRFTQGKKTLVSRFDEGASKINDHIENKVNAGFGKFMTAKEYTTEKGQGLLQKSKDFIAKMVGLTRKLDGHIQKVDDHIQGKIDQGIEKVSDVKQRMQKTLSPLPMMQSISDGIQNRAQTFVDIAKMARNPVANSQIIKEVTSGKKSLSEEVVNKAEGKPVNYATVSFSMGYPGANAYSGMGQNIKTQRINTIDTPKAKGPEMAMA
jgi:methyl-accepting chemotaxis protein